MQTIRCASVALALSVLMSLTPRGAGGAPVAPGATITTDGTGFVAPGGDVVAENSQSVQFLIPEDPTVPEPNFQELVLTLHSQVLRDPVTQRLTFFYELLETPDTLPDFDNEHLGISFSAFAAFTTDVTTSAAVAIIRSGDGNDVTWATPSPIADIAMPVLAIATNATAFDANGNMEGTFSGDVLVGESGVFNVTTPFASPAVFQPIADNGGGGGGTPIPLPPALWTGLLALSVSGVAAKVRRTLRLA